MRNKWTNHVARTVQMIRKQKSDRTAKRKSQHDRYIPTKEHNDKMDIQQHRTECGNENSASGNNA